MEHNHSKISGDRPNLTKAQAANSIKNKAGKPPKLEAILTPSIPELVIIIKATAPMVMPQVTLINKEGSGLSGEMPVELKPLMAEVLESEAVTKDKKMIIRNKKLMI